MLRRALLCLAFLPGGCAHAPLFKDQPIVWRVDDDRDIPEPEEHEYLKLRYFADVFALRRLERTLELRTTESARNTNALDDVPDSTWFQNRIGRHSLSEGQISRGAGGDPPVPPYVITAGKVGGGNAGFVVKDATGRKFLVKFDRHENPEMQTGTGAIVVRLFWALGYNVPSDNVFVLERDDLSIGEGATYKDDLDEKHPFTNVRLEDVLRTSPRLRDGRYRALASELLAGKPKGGFSGEGVREDDPNDRVRHEHRRELRGLRVFAAWLGHTDMKEDNTLDMYVEEDGRRFLRHHLIDFGEAFGAHAGEKDRDEDGFEHFWDWQAQPKAIFALGLWERPWERRKKTPWLSVGAFSALDFEPTAWREAYPYFPFFEAEVADAYWAAKTLLRFDRRHLEAAIATGKLTQPAAARYLAATLVARQKKIGLVYLEAVTPLDELSIRPGALCGVDLGVYHGLATSGTVERLDDDDRVIERRTVSEDGRVCLSIPPDDEYQVYRIRIRRGPDARRAMQIHFKGGPHARILGVIRCET
jgi:hypothetical protein